MVDDDKSKVVDVPSFSYGAHYELLVMRYRNVALSVPALAKGVSLQAKDLLASGEVSANGKFTLEQCLKHLREQGKIEPNRPLLVLGARNNLVNYPAILILRQNHAKLPSFWQGCRNPASRDGKPISCKLA